MVERRLKVLATALAIWIALVFFRLVSLQIFRHPELAQKAKARQELLVTINAPRGAILDREHKVLAMSMPVLSVFINPQQVDVDIAADILSAALHLEHAELRASIQKARAAGRGFLWIKRRLPADETAAIRALSRDLAWIDTVRENQRIYPGDSVAAHVLGAVDFEEKGTAGIERMLEDDLRGVPGKMKLVTDRERRGFASKYDSEARPGAAVVLTIDERIQYSAEQQLAEAVKARGARSGAIVVMNPYNGDVLALASYPSYDPNGPPQKGDAPNARYNHAVAMAFEPGSVFKIITTLAALETTSLTPESLINCHGGALRLPGRIIHDSHAGLGVIPMAMVLAKSSNVGIAEVGMRVGRERMYEYARKMGFGQKTGIDLPGESAGKLRKLKAWGTTSLQSIAMGQEISVTSVQLAQAASIIANGGMMVHPRLVLRKGDTAVPPAQPVRVIRPETAITMRQLMEGVVLRGTGSLARLVGYTVGGKTGSAQIFDREAGHYTHTYNGSFVGFAPLTNPSLVIAVTLNGTTGNAGFGGAAAAPVFKAVATDALRILDVPKDLPDELPTKETTTLIADVSDVDTSRPNILDDSDDDAVAFQGPVLTAAAGPSVPNFLGKTMSDVLAEAAAKGLTVIPRGSGVARSQTPPSGSSLQTGLRIHVEFGR